MFSASLEHQFFLYKKYLDRTTRAIKTNCCETHSIENGKYPELDGLEGDQNYTAELQKISTRAILFELNALLESKLHDFANEAWHSNPKTDSRLMNKLIFLKSKMKIDMVSELTFGDIKFLIEEYYSINIKKIDRFKEIEKMREIVNSFKHKRGLKYNSNVKGEKIIIGKHYITIDYAYESIDNLRIFLRDISKQINSLLIKEETLSQNVFSTEGCKL